MAGPIVFLVFILGTVVGSFLNVVIYRYNTGPAFWRGRSQCLACATPLRWFELIPLLSFLVQAGRCRHCQSRLSFQYPLVELVAGLLFVLAWRLALPLPWTLFYFFVWSLLLVIVVYDLRHKIIPDGPVFALIGLALLGLSLGQGEIGRLNWSAIGQGVFAGGLLFVLLGLVWLVSRGRLMGLGDAKLALAIGLLLGLRGGLSALIFAFWSGAAVGLLLVLLSPLFSRRHYFTMKSEVPFAPFLVLGLFLNFFFKLDVFSLISIFSF